MIREVIEYWQGLQRDRARHLIGSGEYQGGKLWNMCNLMSRRGSLVTRHGLKPVVMGVTGAGNVPVCIFSREKLVPGVDGKEYENDCLFNNRNFMSGASLADLWSGGSSYFDGRVSFAQLAGRVFFADGENLNAVMDIDGEIRPVGCVGQRGAVALSEGVGTAVGLTPDSRYVYGIQRVVVKGNLVVESNVVVGNITLGSGANIVVNVGLDEYEYSVPTGAGWKVHYRIWRSKANEPAELYRIKMNTASGDLEAYQANYVDNDTDGDLDLSYRFIVADDIGKNRAFPVCRFLALWRGRLVGAGSLRRKCSVTTVAGSKLVIPSCAAKQADVDAELRIEGEDSYFVIVNVVGNKWELDRACSSSGMVAGVMEHDNESVYISNAFPDNIEGYDYQNNVISNAGSGNGITGLSVAGDYLYIHRVDRVDMLTEPDGVLRTLPNSPPGCVSNNSVVVFGSRMFYYAGVGGVWEINGVDSRCISGDIANMFMADELVVDGDMVIDHSMNKFSHGVFDVRTRMYHLWVCVRPDLVGGGGVLADTELIYDVERGLWYNGKSFVAMSGGWRDDSGFYPCCGGVDGVAKIDYAVGYDWCDIGNGVYSGVVAGVGVYISSGVPSGVVAGCPMWLLDGFGKWSKCFCVKEVVNNTVYFYSSVDFTGSVTVCFGCIPWFLESGSFDFKRNRFDVERKKIIKDAVVTFGGDVADDLSGGKLLIKDARVAGIAGSGNSVKMDLYCGEDSRIVYFRSIGLRAYEVVVCMWGVGRIEITRLLLKVDQV